MVRLIGDYIIMQTSSQKQLKLVKSSRDGEKNAVNQKSGKSSLAIDEYHQRAEQYAQQIRKTHDVAEIIGILDAVLSETRDLHHSDEMRSAEEQIRYAEQKIESLKHELQLIRELVHTDQLTGLFNRRGLDEFFTREAARADRNKTPLCVILVDLDNFKEINDTHGYLFGDSALAYFAKIVKDMLRPSDVVARYGGEEFVILLPDTRVDEAVHVMRRLQNALTGRPLLNANDQPVSITFSGGVALRQTYEHQRLVIKRAGEALYRAKSAGKSQIEIAS